MTMMGKSETRPIRILLVEDNPGDIRLAQEALKEDKLSSNLYVVNDGVSAMQFLRGEGSYGDMPRPDLVLLDLNLPRMDGREVLAEVKRDPELGKIPIVVLTTSRADEDVCRAYSLNCNCYVTKPVAFDDYIEVIKAIDSFWFSVVALPT